MQAETGAAYLGQGHLGHSDLWKGHLWEGHNRGSSRGRLQGEQAVFEVASTGRSEAGPGLEERQRGRPPPTASEAPQRTLTGDLAVMAA